MEGDGVTTVPTGTLVDIDDRPLSSPSSSAPLSSDAAAATAAAAAAASAAPVVGYWRSGGGLDHVTVRNGGHMLPHDQPVVALAMLGRWSADVLSGSRSRPLSTTSSLAAAAVAAAE